MCSASAKVAASSTNLEESKMNEKFEKWLEAKGYVPKDLTEDQLNPLFATWEEIEGLKAAQAAKPPEKPLKKTLEASGDNDPAADAVAKMREATGAESSRIDAVRKLCAGEHAIEAKAISGGWDEQRTELELLRAARPAGPAIHAGGDASGEINATATEISLCRSAGVQSKIIEAEYDEKAITLADSSEYRGASIQSVFHDVIRASGGHVRRGRFGDEDIRDAFRADRSIQAAGGFSTISLAGTLSNVANKTLLESFTAVESVVGTFCDEVDHLDFKQASKYRVTGKGVFLQIGPDGEIKHTELTDETYTNQVDTFGRMIALTRQTIINDDLGAFLRIPRILGRQAALARERAVFELLLSNPGSFYSAGNGNNQSGAPTALSITSLTTAEQLFLDQIDSDGQPILISPAILLVPTTLKVTAQQLMTETRVNELAIEDTATPLPWPDSNPHAGKWQPVASPYLNSQSLAGQSSTGWYLFANPADVAAMEIAYLRGQRNPTIESGETDFNTLGMQWRGYWDFGIAMQDHRGSVRSVGA